MSHFRIEKLTLSNFRCFKSCEVTPHPALTVLVGENGQGKTALLEAAVLLFSNLLSSEVPQPIETRLSHLDLHLTAEDLREHRRAASGYVEFSCSIAHEGEEASVGRMRLRHNQERRIATLSEPLKSFLRRVGEALEATTSPATSFTLPLLAYYPTRRGDVERYRPSRGRTGSFLSRRDGYALSLAAQARFGDFEKRYRGEMAAAATAPIFGQKDRLRPELVASVVAEAVGEVLAPTGWGGLHWGERWPRLMAEHPEHGSMPLGFLSAGTRSIAAMVGDIALRCAVLNPHLASVATKETPGVVLIDEIDLHLHPRWQQQILDLLRATFPLLQFIVTTHSPHVLSAADKSSIRIIRLDHGTAEIIEPQYQTRGVQSADVLAEIMGVDPVPRVEQAIWLQKYRAEIEMGRSHGDAAMELRDRLEQHFGPTHPVMLDCDRLIRFQAFKLRTGRTA